MKERAADVRDIGKRMMAVVKGVKLPDLGVLTECNRYGERYVSV